MLAVNPALSVMLFWMFQPRLMGYNTRNLQGINSCKKVVNEEYKFLNYSENKKAKDTKRKVSYREETKVLQGQVSHMENLVSTISLGGSRSDLLRKLSSFLETGEGKMLKRSDISFIITKAHKFNSWSA